VRHEDDGRRKILKMFCLKGARMGIACVNFAVQINVLHICSFSVLKQDIFAI
jgi:hypothetical protein